MPSYYLAPIADARAQFFTAQGAVLNGGLLYSYAATSTTPQNTYTDSTGGTANNNPIQLNSDGRTPSGVYLTGGLSYKFVLKDSAGNTLWTQDVVSGVNDVSATASEWIAGPAPTYTSATQFTLAGDQTSVFTVGRRCKFTVTAGTVYGAITASAFAALTTVTVAIDSGSLDSGLSAVYYGLLAADNPSVPWAKVSANLAGVVSPSQITSNQNNYSPTSLAVANVLRVSSDARRSLTGLAGGTSGRLITIHNVGTFPVLFKFEDGNSTATNRFAFGHTLSGGHSMRVEYDNTTLRWRCTFKEIPAGTILPFGGGTVPEGYLARDGSNVSRTTYAALFNEVGTTWGVGDGATTFGLGDDRRRVWVGSGGAGTATLAATVGSTGGEETHTLTTPEIASHNHAPLTATLGFYGESAGANLEQYAGGARAPVIDATTGNTGGGGAHNNMQPSAVVTAVIKY